MEYIGIIETQKDYYHVIKKNKKYTAIEIIGNVGIQIELETAETLEELYEKIIDREATQIETS